MRCEGGIVVWEGPSRFDKKSPIVVYLQWPGTGNKKIGFMAQAWIFRADMKPIEAVARRADRAICGGCPRAHGNKCYVQTHRLTAMWNSIPFCQRVTPEVAGKRLAGQRLRIGAYGDPAAVPASVWKALTRHTLGHTGYTHSPGSAPELRGLIMASADNEKQARYWQSKGWQTYRALEWSKEGVPEPLIPGEALCPADENAPGGKTKSCAECLKCGSEKRGNIAIHEHSGVTMSRLATLRKKGCLPVIQPKRITADAIVKGALTDMSDSEIDRLMGKRRIG